MKWLFANGVGQGNKHMSKKLKRKKLTPLPKLKKKAWALISKHVRSKGADFSGRTSCYTCYKVDYWKNMDCGHYIHNKLDFNLNNLKPQCTYCNKYQHGNLGLYGERLTKEYGIGWVEELRKLARAKGNNYSRQELTELILEYE